MGGMSTLIEILRNRTSRLAAARMVRARGISGEPVISTYTIRVAPLKLRNQPVDDWRGDRGLVDERTDDRRGGTQVSGWIGSRFGGDINARTNIHMGRHPDRCRRL